MNAPSAPPQPPPAFGGIVDLLMNAEQGAGLSALDLYTTWLGNVTKAQSELLRFVGERLSKDAQMLAQFAQCRTPADVAQLQAKLGGDAMSDYFAETQRMLALFTPGAAPTSAAT